MNFPTPPPLPVHASGSNPGCLKLSLTTLVLLIAAAFGIETWVDRWSWPVDTAWYRITESGNTVKFGCQNFAETQFSGSASPSTTRILVIGGSTTFGFPERPTSPEPIRHARHGFVGSMQAALDASWPGRFELINLGVNGGASEDTLRIFRRAMRWGAHGAIVYDGHNEFMGVPRQFSPWWWQFATYRRFAVLAPRVVESPGWVGAPAYGTPQQAAAVVARFRENLSEIVATAQSAGMPIVVATQASNLSGFQPNWSTSGPADLAAGRSPHQSEAQWASHPESADLAFAVGTARILGGGNADEAFRAARDHDAMPFRATTMINTVIRDVAAQDRVTLVDADALFSAAGTPGLASFYDWVHPKPDAAAFLADAMLEGMARAGMLPGPPAVPRTAHGSRRRGRRQGRARVGRLAPVGVGPWARPRRSALTGR